MQVDAEVRTGASVVAGAENGESVKLKGLLDSSLQVNLSKKRSIYMQVF